MTTKLLTSRRGTIRALVAATLLLPTRPTDPNTALRGLFRELRSARALGAAYLRTYPAAARDVATLPTAPTVTALRSAIAARVRDDFANARVVTVDGWLLSLTEARLCALAYLVT